MLRGEPGTKVTLTLNRAGSPEPEIELDVPRKLVRLPDVTLAAMLEGGVGYIKLDGFSEGTAQEVRHRRLDSTGSTFMDDSAAS